MENSKSRYVINEEEKGIRLDRCIAVLNKEISRMAVQRLLDDGKITVNRKKRKTFLQGANSEI